MSLLDDVSIVVTPNGYKAGELYAVVPVPSEGAELIINGDFATDTDWTKGTGWTISGGSANSDGVNSFSSLSQASVLTIGKRYKLIVDINLTSGQLRIQEGGVILETYTTTGVNTATYYFIATATNITFKTGPAPFLGSIDNVSVKEYTSADMDVTRATAGTRVDEDGLVNYAEIVSDTELVTNGDFATDSDWTKGTGWTISGGTASCDGSQSGNTDLSQNITTDTGKQYKITYTVSNYSAGSIFIRLNSGNITSTKSSNGTFTEILSGAGGTQVILRANLDFIGSVDNVSVKEVTRDNVPRIDYTGGGCPHILAEPQRTNLITYSEDFTQWSSKINIDVTLNSETSPDGVVNATFINENNSNAQHFIGQSLSITNGQDISISVYAKKNQRDVLQISPSGNYLSTSGYANYDLNNGLVTASGGGVTAEIEGLTNGWFRCVAKFTANNTASGTTAFFLQNSTTASRGSSYDGDGTSGLYMWGAQTEIGSYPTSYIPTSGSTVTRNKDQFSRDGIGSLINSTEGTLVIEPRYFINDGSGTGRKISISDGTSSNRIYITPYQFLASRIRYIFTSGGSTQADLQVTGIDITVSRKLAFVWATNRFELWQNGVKISEDTSGATPSTGTFNQINFSSETGDGSDPFEGELKQLQVYNTALTDAQLTSLTT